MSIYKKIEIYYFSGTGNSKRVSMWIQEFALSKGIDCQLTDISKIEANSQHSECNTLIIIISAIHGFNFPKITLDFIRHLPKGQNDIVLMNTRGGAKIGKIVTPGLIGIAFILSSIILKNKGYKITGQIPFDMPSNWISIHPALNQKSVKIIHEKNYVLTEKYCHKIFAGKSTFVARRDLIQDILISPVSLGYYIAGRFFLAKSYYASVDCDNCGLCIKQCPVKAIKQVNKRPFWTFKCESCMKCMSNCPKKAIETAHGLFLGISIICSLLRSYILNELFLTDIQSAILRFMYYSAVFLLLLPPFYLLQHALLKNKIIGKIISLTSLTHYKFWGRYKSIDDRKWRK
ncbi:MAG: EFR1 family ferrodoxin [Dysgonomonas sp.]